jgi:Rrf2 family protein
MSAIIEDEIRQKYSDIERGEMMKLSTKGRYGLRAMVDLALYGETEPVSIASIAARQSISESYLEQLLAKLRRAGLVTSIRGAAGGYVPGRPADEISVGDILRALEGSLDPVDCPGIEGRDGCEGSDVCVTKYVWKRINESINRTVDEIKLRELVEESRAVQKKSQIPISCCEKKE